MISVQFELILNKNLNEVGSNFNYICVILAKIGKFFLKFLNGKYAVICIFI
jgi:hypothetical protein